MTGKTSLAVAFCGGTCAGKSTYVEGIVKHFSAEDICVISQDSYYKDQSHLSLAERYQVNYDHPDSLDLDLMLAHLNLLKQGASVEIPIFEYVQCIRLPETQTVVPSPIILVDGILMLHHNELREVFDLIFYIEADADVRLLRRLRRDMERGMEFEDIARQYEEHVRPMHEQFIEPYKPFADFIVENNVENPRTLEHMITLLNSYNS